jgi:ABC-2 type transport system permease protein
VRLASGSWPWLLRHELRLAWRGFGGKTFRRVLALAAFLWLVYHVALGLIVATAGWGTLGPVMFVIAGLSAWFFCSLILSNAISLSVAALFERGDLDLLLASPIAPRNVFIVRALGIAISVVALYALLLVPLGNVGLFSGEAELLAIYPALLAAGLLAAALGLALAVALVRLLGARRARVVAQIAGALVGAAAFLASQFGRLIAPERTSAWLLALPRATAKGGWLARDSLLWLPLNAMLGRPLALALFCGAGIGAFGVVVVALERHFLASTQEPVTSRVARGAEHKPARFRAGLWRNVMVKEWKLIGRDPQVIARTLLQGLYLLPLAFLWMRKDAPQATLAPAAVLLAATLASGLVWLTVAAEDAPDLLASAPVAPHLLRRAKLLAALLPVWLLMLPLVLALAYADLRMAALFVPCVGAATLSTGSIQLALARPGQRRRMRQRSPQPIAALLEFVTTVAWAATTWLLIHAPLFAPLAAALAIAAPVVAWRWGQRLRAESGSA